MATFTSKPSLSKLLTFTAPLLQPPPAPASPPTITPMKSHNRLVSFIWSIADDCLRDVYVRGKYRDVILPMIVLRRLDALLEPGKEKVLAELDTQKRNHEEAEAARKARTKGTFYPTPFVLDGDTMEHVANQVFYNTSPWTLRKLYDTATNSSQILLANFEAYLDGFSDNVKEIVDKFSLRRQVRHMATKDVLLAVIEKFTSSDINLTPFEKLDKDGRKLPALSNLGMGYVFEELIRKFNEENNEEAGEHFTPREVIDLMTHLVFDPLKDRLPAIMTIYDPACGSGGMLTESQNFIMDPDGNIRADANTDVILFGKEINDETYAICKSDMMIKGNDPGNIRVGSTLRSDEFSDKKFDFMLSNPPYGKSWSGDVQYIKDKKEIIDPRFEVTLQDYWGNEEKADATPRSSDGQLLFLMEMVSKMKDPSLNGGIGSRIASVHNGSSLFTGDAGGGESNIRRYLIENDLLEGIIQMPNNLFYNTGITTYIWLLNNAKAKARKGKVFLIDASELYTKLRKNLGAKNCEFTPGHIAQIQQAFQDFRDVDMGAAAGAKEDTKKQSGLRAKVFRNDDFGYFKATIERPQRLRAQFTPAAIAELRFDRQLREPMAHAWETYGDQVYTNLPAISKELLTWCEKNELSLSTKLRKKLTTPATWAKGHDLLNLAHHLMDEIGQEPSLDFNKFQEQVSKTLKATKLKPATAEKNAIYGAITEYDPDAQKVIKKKLTLKGDKLNHLLEHLDCTVADLPLYGYYPTPAASTYLTYETSSDLRDTESIPLTDNIQAYFLREVQPHVTEAWIHLDKTKVGFEISFNKYFYRHTPLRTLEEVSAEILVLEEKSEGVITEILNF
jgi:type I restriction enzyme M protein